MTKGTIKNRTGIVAHRQWVIAFSGLFRNSPNLFPRDRDSQVETLQPYEKIS